MSSNGSTLAYQQKYTFAENMMQICIVYPKRFHLVKQFSKYSNYTGMFRECESSPFNITIYFDVDFPTQVCLSKTVTEETHRKKVQGDLLHQVHLIRRLHEDLSMLTTQMSMSEELSLTIANVDTATRKLEKILMQKRDIFYPSTAENWCINIRIGRPTLTPWHKYPIVLLCTSNYQVSKELVPIETKTNKRFLDVFELEYVIPWMFYAWQSYTGHRPLCASYKQEVIIHNANSMSIYDIDANCTTGFPLAKKGRIVATAFNKKHVCTLANGGQLQILKIDEARGIKTVLKERIYAIAVNDTYLFVVTEETSHTSLIHRYSFQGEYKSILRLKTCGLCQLHATNTHLFVVDTHSVQIYDIESEQRITYFKCLVDRISMNTNITVRDDIVYLTTGVDTDIYIIDCFKRIVLVAKVRDVGDGVILNVLDFCTKGLLVSLYKEDGFCVGMLQYIGTSDQTLMKLQ